MPSFKYRISSFTSSGENSIPFNTTGLFLIVGPNNCGKSRLLAELEMQWNGDTPEGSNKVVSEVSVDFEVDWNTFEKWLRDKYGSTILADGQIRFAGIGAQSVARVENLGKSGDWIKRGEFRGFVVSKLDTESRLQLSNPPNRIEVYGDKPEHFIHVMQSNEDVYQRIKKEVKAAFDLDIVIDYAGGRTVPLYVGKEPQMQAGWDRVHPDYCRAVRNQMELLQEAGDGVRSYVVCLASALSESQPVLLIDEPEAFLHPPQSRRIGKLLAELASERKKQILVATHSSDLVRGALSSGRSVSVMRLDRVTQSDHEEINRVNLLDSANLKSLWKKPLLKSSSAIDGIFHKGVIISESDSDSRFCEALILRSEGKNLLSSPADYHFVQGHGKSSFKTLANSYTKLQVPVVVISDFDLFRERPVFKNVIDSLGGEFSDFIEDYNELAKALRDQPPIENEQQALKEIETHVQAIKGRKSRRKYNINRDDRHKIRDLLEGSRKWSKGKKYGITRLKGDPLRAGKRLLSSLAKIGLFVIPSGELESWNRDLPQGNKQAWITDALELIASDSDSFVKAEKFVVASAEYLDSQ